MGLITRLTVVDAHDRRTHLVDGINDEAIAEAASGPDAGASLTLAGSEGSTTLPDKAGSLQVAQACQQKKPDLLSGRQQATEKRPDGGLAERHGGGGAS